MFDIIRYSYIYVENSSISFFLCVNTIIAAVFNQIMMIILYSVGFSRLPSFLNDGTSFFVFFICLKIMYNHMRLIFSTFSIITGEITLVRPLDEISAITHIGDPVLLTVIAEEVKVLRDEPPAMATTVQIALFMPERSNSPPYFENDQ